MQGYIGVKFLLNHGAFLSVAMSEAKAKELLEAFKPSAFGKIDSAMCSPPPGHTTRWAVLTNTIQAIHTFELEQPTGGTQYVSGIPLNR